MSIYTEMKKIAEMNSKSHKSLNENVVTVSIPVDSIDNNSVDNLEKKLASVLGVDVEAVEITINGGGGRLVVNVDGNLNSDDIETELKNLIGLTEEVIEEMAMPDVRNMSRQELSKLASGLKSKPANVIRKYQDELIKRVKKFLDAGKKDPAAELQAQQKFLASIVGNSAAASSGAAEIEWANPFESLKEGESEVVSNGDIVAFKDNSPYHRDGYFRTDIEHAVGSSPDNPWIGGLEDGRGWYVSASELEVVIPADEYDTDELTNDEEVEDMLNGMDEAVVEEMEVNDEEENEGESLTEAELASKLSNSVKTPKAEKVDTKGGKVEAEKKDEDTAGPEWVNEIYLKLSADDLRALHRVVMNFDSKTNKNATESSINITLTDLVSTEIYDGGGLSGIADRSDIPKKDIVKLVNYLITGDNEIEVYDAKVEKANKIKGME